MNKPKNELTTEEIERGLTLDDLATVQHALGIDEYRPKQQWGFRNYYCAAPDDKQMERLIHLNLLTAGRKINEGQDQYFYVTQAGARFAGLPKEKVAEMV